MNRHEKALEILRHGTVIPATTLALNDDGSFNEARQRLLIRYYLEAGAGGIATAVHSTQFEIRKPEFNLFERVISIVTDEIDRYESETGKVILKVCGVCGPAEQAVREAELARSLGFDAVLVSPGGLAHLTEEEMLERARKVAEVLPIIGFYLQTAVGGRVFTYDFWCKLAQIPNLKAIKCASFNRYTTLDVMRAITLSGRADEIALYTGNDDNIVVDLLTNYRFTIDGKTYTNRFRGGLLGHWSVWTHKVVELFEELRTASASDDYLTLAAEITDCNAVFFDAANAFKGCIPGMHEILRRQGLVKSIRCLNPEEILSPGQAEEIDRVYAMYPHLNDDAFVKAFLARHPMDK
ncbi:MAG: dihydrodipicolinate synthase family protein [Ruminococcaceae bacterium]|nr:dihydrodipicolinate synthase family protein [Oscillospiraceae bacterium]